MYQFFFSFLALGASFGDPHIITLDNVEYTFNGFGEYTVLNVNNTEFILQGRMQPLNVRQTEKSSATVFTAFAMRQKGGSSIQVSFTILNFHSIVLVSYNSLGKCKPDLFFNANIVWGNILFICIIFFIIFPNVLSICEILPVLLEKKVCNVKVIIISNT